MDDIDYLSGNLWKKLLILMGLLPLFGALMDYGLGVQAGMGRINNMMLLFLPVFFGVFGANMRYLREPGDRRFMYFALALGVFIFLRTTLAPLNEFIGGMGATIILLCIVAALGAYGLARRGLDVSRMLVVSILLAAVFAPLALILVAVNPEAYEIYYVKVYGYSNIRVLGYFVGPALVVGILMLPTFVQKVHKTKFYCLLGLMTVTWSLLFWSGSRAAFVAVIVAIVISWALISWPGIKSAIMAGATMVSGAWMSLSYYEPSHHFGLISRFNQTAAGIASGDLTRITTNRSDLWSWAVDRIMDAPVFGHGMFPMSYLRTEEFNFYHTHNVILEYMLGLGIPMGLVVIATVAVLYLRAGSVARKSVNPFAVAAFGAVTFYATSAQMNVVLFFPIHLLIFLSGLAGLIALSKSRE